MQQHSSKYYARRTPVPGVGVKRSKLTFSEHGHVSYQIKENEANILIADHSHPLTLELGSKGQN